MWDSAPVPVVCFNGWGEIGLGPNKRRTAGDVFDERIRWEIRTFENWRRQPELFSPLFWRFVEMVWWMREKKKWTRSDPIKVSFVSMGGTAAILP